LIEVDFPLAVVNAACQRENNRKTRPESKHLSLLHTWWARRPLTSCRAVLLGLLFPAPADPSCPEHFKTAARKIIGQFKKIDGSDEALQQALLHFLAEISNPDLVTKNVFVSAARELVKSAYIEPPHVFDPFAGGGSIPFEALRLGCEVTASELNPVAWLLLKIALEWSARKGEELLRLFEEWSEWVLKEVEKRLTPFYPPDREGRKALAYLWARKVRCEAPECGATVPLIRNLWLSQSERRKKALRISYRGGELEPSIEVFRPETPEEVQKGTVSGFKARCPRCGRPMQRERVQAQLRMRRGGAADAILLAVVRENPGGRGKDYFNPTSEDLQAIKKADEKAKSINIGMPSFPAGDTRAFPPHPYGITNWADVLTPRQKLSRWVIYRVIEDALEKAGKEIDDPEFLLALSACLYAAYSDNAQYHTSLCVWLSEGVKSIFIQGSGVPMRADFVEGSPLSPNCEGLEYSIKSVSAALEGLVLSRHRSSSPILANVLDPLLPEESTDIVFTDPPYANQIPYAHLSDFFYGWLKLGLKKHFPHAFGREETEKVTELTENRAISDGERIHDRKWYEEKMKEAFSQLRKSIKREGVTSIIFAHKDTDRWEALISALISAGWQTTASWPIATERRQRMRGQGYAALETSVHLICRPRPEDAPVGDWQDVLRELPRRVREWMERLQGEGIRGADLVFACIGPALEIFSQYSRVETAEGTEITLEKYLEKVWEVVGRIALEQVLGTEAAGGGSTAPPALEEDARLTALFLWTLQSTELNEGSNTLQIKEADEEYEEENEWDEEEEPKKKKKGGLSLPFDVVRRFAQPLGIHLPIWEGRIIETKKGIVRLLSIKERAKILFGREDAEAFAERVEKATQKGLQLELFPTREVAESRPRGRRRIKVLSEEALQQARGATTLDRVHVAMLLQATGQTNALRSLIASELERGPEFLRLANALSALYPKGCEEKRLIDAMLLAVPK